MENDDDDDEVEEVEIQEEQGVPVPPDWVEMVQNLDVTLDAHQVDKIVMLLQCHSKMLEHQVMVSKMLAELGKLVESGDFQIDSADSDMAHPPHEHPRLAHTSTQEAQEGNVDEGGKDGSPHCTQPQSNERLGG